MSLEHPTKDRLFQALPAERQNELISTIQRRVKASYPSFYLLTNSRSLPLAQAQVLNKEIGLNLRAAAQHTRRDFVVVSRSDSTPRGHFPGEVSALEDGLGSSIDNRLVSLVFLKAGATHSTTSIT